MRIGIVNDRPLAVAALRRAVSLEPEHDVIWVAKNGAEAIAMCEREMPHLVLMDLLMPEMDGVEATRRIMASTPCPILIVTMSVAANAGRAFDAMGYGALDVVDTPAFVSDDLRLDAAPLLTKIDTIGRMTGERRLRTREPRPVHHAQLRRLVAIGASAGGPAALALMLRALPASFSAGIVVVQHVDESFATGMADWLSDQCSLSVRIAHEGDAPSPGTVLLAGSSDHLAVNSSGRLYYTPEPIEYVYRPSVDVFFESVSRHWPGDAIGVLLTGMGRDGALGLKAIRNKGFHTIAQDEATCAVYGMPKAAVKLNAATEILAVDRIAPRLVDLIARQP